jgi:ribonuclease VapC
VIAVDTSALMAVILNEPEGEACALALDRADELLISAATLAEVLIVSSRRGLGAQMSALLARLEMTVAPVFEADGRRAAEAHDHWGKGVHPAALNLGDCFAYVVAKERGCPLLYVGADFAQTDVQSAELGKGG